MAYDEGAAERIRLILNIVDGITERKMFGGIGFMVNGNMCCGVLRDNLVVRLGEDGVTQASKKKHTKTFDFTGRTMKNMLYVNPEGYESDEDLEKWISRALKFAQSLPKK